MENDRHSRACADCPRHQPALNSSARASTLRFGVSSSFVCAGSPSSGPGPHQHHHHHRHSDGVPGGAKGPH